MARRRPRERDSEPELDAEGVEPAVSPQESLTQRIRDFGNGFGHEFTLPKKSRRGLGPTESDRQETGYPVLPRPDCRMQRRKATMGEWDQTRMVEEGVRG